MKDYIQYHKISEYGQPNSSSGDFRAFTAKSVDKMQGNRVWLISGENQLGKIVYNLEYVFMVEQVENCARNELRGSQGVKPSRPIRLNGRPWFTKLQKKHANFSRGMAPVGDEFIAQLEELMGLP